MTKGEHHVVLHLAFETTVENAYKRFEKVPGKGVFTQGFHQFCHGGKGNKKTSYIEKRECEEAATNDTGYELLGEDNRKEKTKQIAKYPGHEHNQTEFQHLV